jgi:hypothetical protein
MVSTYHYKYCDTNICYLVFNFYHAIRHLNICLNTGNIFSSRETDSNYSSLICCRFKRDVFLQGDGHDKR